MNPLTIIILGGTGDLTWRKLIPALFDAASKVRLDADVQILGVSRSPMSDEQFRTHLRVRAEAATGQALDAERWQRFAQLIHYQPGDAASAAGIAAVKSWLERREAGRPADRLFYFSVAPELFPRIVSGLAEAGLTAESNGYRRLVLEKPFGRDQASAQALNQHLHRFVREDQLFRIDHYLGKETVQNIMVFRFANTMFEPLWNNQYIDHVQITVAETVAVGSRGPYYDSAGVIRDMIQGHLLQVMSMIAMEAPSRFEAQRLRNEKVKVLDAVMPPSLDEACRSVALGQYDGYRSEPGVAPDSRTPTFAAVRLHIDNWRWRGVPFYLRSGKAMAQRFSDVVIQFRCPPHLMFSLPQGETLECNRLTLRIQPDEGIRITFETKVPDRERVELRPADLSFKYQEAYGTGAMPEAYERLLLDAIHGDASLFTSAEEIERAWAIVDPMVEASERPDAPPPAIYAVGSYGPTCADELLARDGRAWQNPALPE